MKWDGNFNMNIDFSNKLSVTGLPDIPYLTPSMKKALGLFILLLIMYLIFNQFFGVEEVVANRAPVWVGITKG